MIPIAAQIKCARRELAIRGQVYPGWVKRKRMTSEDAAKELDGMEAIVETLERVEKIEAFLSDPKLVQSGETELAQLVCDLIGLEEGEE